MKHFYRITAAVIAAFFSACGGSASDSGSNSGTPIIASAASVDPATLCVASSCGTKTRLLQIPNAENTLFTPDGRLFVSGSSNVYEVTKNAAGAFHATPLDAASADFTGLAQRGQVLYATAGDGNLYAAQLDTAPPSLKPIYKLAGVVAPNGVTTGPDGEIYLTDGPTSTSPKIVRLEFDPDDPLTVTQQTTWLTQGVGLPNGLSRSGNTLYFSDTTLLPPALGSVKTVQIQADGSPGPVQTFFSVDTSVPDDLSVVGGDVLLALYSEGAIALVGGDGKLISMTDPLSFQLPSSVKPGQPPMFDPTDLIVTEKGVVGVPETGALFGNELSVFRRNP